MNKYWHIIGAVIITAFSLYGFRPHPEEAVRVVTEISIGGVSDYLPVEIYAPRVTLDLGAPFDSVVPSVPEVRTLKPPSMEPLRLIADRPVGGGGVQFTVPISSENSKPVVQVNHGQAFVKPLYIEWPDRTPKHLTGKVRVIVNYDSRGLIDSLRIESEYPANLGFGESVVKALKEERIVTQQPVRLTYDIDVKYGEKPVVKFASAGLVVK